MLTWPAPDNEPAAVQGPDVAELLSALMDRSLGDAEAALLADRILDDPRALAEYCEIIDLECLLAREFSSRAAIPSCSASVEVP